MAILPESGHAKFVKFFNVSSTKSLFSSEYQIRNDQIGPKNPVLHYLKQPENTEKLSPDQKIFKFLDVSNTNQTIPIFIRIPN